MARLASIAVAGYFPTPSHLVRRIGSLARPFIPPEPKEGSSYYYSSVATSTAFLDPCAGEGDAIQQIVELLQPSKRGDPKIYICEMEEGRFQAAKNKLGWGHAQLEGDAFRVSFSKGSRAGIAVLFLNPPYDTDPVHGRLEQKFLERFTQTLMDGGILFFVVPYYALLASAETLATEYTDLHCYRFPGEDFNVYKQVVLFAKKRGSLFAPDPEVVQLVSQWGKDASLLPELPEEGKEVLCQVPVVHNHECGLDEWTIRSVDITALKKKCRPWMQSPRGFKGLIPIQGILPEVPIQDVLLRHHPMATPPRPAHIAAGIASGLFNGSRLEPSDPSTGLPPILVKGAFDREYRTIEEKTSQKTGEVKAVVQVQQPKLVTTILDLRSHKYYTLGNSLDESGTLDVSKMGVADLLKYYGESMLQVMERQCPITYDPRRDTDSIQLHASPRRLYTAQTHASKAIVKVLGGTETIQKRLKQAVLFLGEIGSGKTTSALIAARSMGASRILAVCPPHLLTSWANEVKSVLPEADFRVLSTVTDLQELEKLRGNGRTVVAVMSREAAKLGHGWEGVGRLCPKCGSLTPTNVDLAKKRARCTHKPLIAGDALAAASVKLAYKLLPYAPSDPEVGNLLRGRGDLRRITWHKKIEEAKKLPSFEGPDVALLREMLEHVELLYNNSATPTEQREKLRDAVVLLLLAIGDDNLIAEVSNRIAGSDTSVYYYSFAQQLLLMLPPGGSLQEECIKTQKSRKEAATSHYYSTYDEWGALRARIKAVQESNPDSYTTRVGSLQVSWYSGSLSLGEMTPRSLKANCEALSAARRNSKFYWGQECGEFLFGAVPEPRRIALARHIQKYYPDLFDLLILDEGHEYGTDGSAQERAAHRLTSLQLPVIWMTGTTMNGYALSMFTTMWALFRDFRAEFPDRNGDQIKYVDRFGYRKRILEDKDRDTGDIVEFGTVSDRVTRSERFIGYAPGILPLFILQYLLPHAVTLHKADLAIDLPPCRQHRENVVPEEELLKRYKYLQAALVSAIKEDQFTPDRAGRLFGQLAELPSYLDRATEDVGNTDDGSYEIRYPESIGGALVAKAKPFPADMLLPKEKWILDRMEQELSEGRNVMIFPWHINLLPRIARLVAKRFGPSVSILYADKVPTAKRQAWIDREVVEKGHRVLVANPVAIQTGLNNLVYFATQIWHQNPSCHPLIYRQSMGRVDRIGQKRDTHIYFPIYAGTLQEKLYDLLMHKVAVSISTDGLDPESALQAAGVGEEEYLAGLSIGKQLWRLFSDS